ncbi:MAG: Gfo/Idh/MocA family oxidoreductase [Acidobacteria bacterium]|nr:Gfo/Idh/MocA family oxidoreductase [Acidobacteriota bacterium]
MKPIRTAIFGTGFMGRVHLEGVRRVESVEVAAVVGRREEAAQRLGAGFSVPTATTDYRQVLRDGAIDAVHVCTTNAEHYRAVKDALEAGKHVLCEKPLTTTVKQAQELASLADRHGLRNCVCHNLRFYPLVQQMRQLCASGELGEILVVQGTYSQDWLLYDTDWNWRVDREASGVSRCMADIGSHFFDMAEHITGLRVTSVCADLQTFHRTRKKPRVSIETFANKLMGAGDYEATPVETEDFGAVVFQMGSRTRGCMSASQVAAGRKNGLRIEVYGSRASLAWGQERPNELWMGRRDTGNAVFIKDPALLAPEARSFADLPGGHSEGYDDTFKQIFRRFYGSIRSAAGPEYPQFIDGLRQLKILDAVLQSNENRSWVNVPV